MSNDVSNTLYIISPSKERDEEILEFIKGDEEECVIDFNKILPKPENEPEEVIDKPTNNRFRGSIKHNWYYDNWGTRWNSYSGYETETNIKKRRISVLSFQTAWTPPIPVLRQLLSLFPDTYFLATWANEDFGIGVGIACFSTDEKCSFGKQLDRSLDGYGLASYILGYSIDDIYDFSDEDDPEDVIRERIEQYNLLRGSLLVESKLLMIVDNIEDSISKNSKEESNNDVR